MRAFKISLDAEVPTGLVPAAENQEFLIASKITDKSGVGINTIDVPAPDAA